MEGLGLVFDDVLGKLVGFGAHEFNPSARVFDRGRIIKSLLLLNGLSVLELLLRLYTGYRHRRP